MRESFKRQKADVVREFDDRSSQVFLQLNEQVGGLLGWSATQLIEQVGGLLPAAERAGGWLVGVLLPPRSPHFCLNS